MVKPQISSPEGKWSSKKTACWWLSNFYFAFVLVLNLLHATWICTFTTLDFTDLLALAEQVALNPSWTKALLSSPAASLPALVPRDFSACYFCGKCYRWKQKNLRGDRGRTNVSTKDPAQASWSGCRPERSEREAWCLRSFSMSTPPHPSFLHSQAPAQKS